METTSLRELVRRFREAPPLPRDQRPETQYWWQHGVQDSKHDKTHRNGRDSATTAPVSQGTRFAPSFAAPTAKPMSPLSRLRAPVVVTSNASIGIHQPKAYQLHYAPRLSLPSITGALADVRTGQHNQVGDNLFSAGDYGARMRSALADVELDATLSLPSGSVGWRAGSTINAESPLARFGVATITTTTPHSSAIAALSQQARLQSEDAVPQPRRGASRADRSINNLDNDASVDLPGLEAHSAFDSANLSVEEDEDEVESLALGTRGLRSRGGDGGGYPEWSRRHAHPLSAQLGDGHPSTVPHRTVTSALLLPTFSVPAQTAPPPPIESSTASDAQQRPRKTAGESAVLDAPRVNDGHGAPSSSPTLASPRRWQLLPTTLANPPPPAMRLPSYVAPGAAALAASTAAWQPRLNPSYHLPALSDTAALISAALDVSMAQCARRVANISGDEGIMESLPPSVYAAFYGAAPLAPPPYAGAADGTPESTNTVLATESATNDVLDLRAASAAGGATAACGAAEGGVESAPLGRDVVGVLSSGAETLSGANSTNKSSRAAAAAADLAMQLAEDLAAARIGRMPTLPAATTPTEPAALPTTDIAPRLPSPREADKVATHVPVDATASALTIPIVLPTLPRQRSGGAKSWLSLVDDDDAGTPLHAGEAGAAEPQTVAANLSLLAPGASDSVLVSRSVDDLSRGPNVPPPMTTNHPPSSRVLQASDAAIPPRVMVPEPSQQRQREWEQGSSSVGGGTMISDDLKPSESPQQRLPDDSAHTSSQYSMASRDSAEGPPPAALKLLRRALQRRHTPLGREHSADAATQDATALNSWSGASISASTAGFRLSQASSDDADTASPSNVLDASRDTQSQALRGTGRPSNSQGGRAAIDATTAAGIMRRAEVALQRARTIIRRPGSSSLDSDTAVVTSPRPAAVTQRRRYHPLTRPDVPRQVSLLGASTRDALSSRTSHGPAPTPTNAVSPVVETSRLIITAIPSSEPRTFDWEALRTRAGTLTGHSEPASAVSAGGVAVETAVLPQSHEREDRLSLEKPGQLSLEVERRIAYLHGPQRQRLQQRLASQFGLHAGDAADSVPRADDGKSNDDASHSTHHELRSPWLPPPTPQQHAMHNAVPTAAPQSPPLPSTFIPLDVALQMGERASTAALHSNFGAVDAKTAGDRLGGSPSVQTHTEKPFLPRPGRDLQTLRADHERLAAAASGSEVRPALLQERNDPLPGGGGALGSNAVRAFDRARDALRRATAVMRQQ